jgi:hypothetical protein
MKKGKIYPKCDPATRRINRLILKIPKVGARISQLYLWRYTMFNFMIVGGTGMVLSFLLYEGILRRILIVLWGGTFLGMLITTFIVFLWNFFWNQYWSLSIKSQLLNMDHQELLDLHDQVMLLLNSKFDDEGKRIGWQ